MSDLEQPGDVPARITPEYYTGTNANGHPFIQCRTCGLRSFNTNDVKQRYCCVCKVFHEEHVITRNGWMDRLQ